MGNLEWLVVLIVGAIVSPLLGEITKDLYKAGKKRLLKRRKPPKR